MYLIENFDYKYLILEKGYRGGIIHSEHDQSSAHGHQQSPDQDINNS